MGGFLLAFAGGMLSFLSPCVLPLVPGYLSLMSGVSVTQLAEGSTTAVDLRRILRSTLLFVAGFTVVFTVLGIGATLIGSLFLRNQDTVVRFFGVVIIAMGLVTMGAVRVPALMREKRLDLTRVPRGPAFAFPMGMAFAAGWAPCIGPILATILATAAATGTVAWGAILLVLYSIGLGIPFVLLALGFSRAQRSLSWLRRHGRHIEIAGGLLLVAVGVLFVSGRWGSMFRPLQRWFAQLGWPPI